MNFTDKRAFRIAEASEELEELKKSLGSATVETLPQITEAIRAAVARKEAALAMPQHVYQCLLCGLKEGDHKHFESAGRTVLEVRAIISHDGEGNVISEQHFRQDPVYIVVCPTCHTRKKVVQYLTNRWSKESS